MSVRLEQTPISFCDINRQRLQNQTFQMNNHYKNYPRGNFFLKNDYSPQTLILQIYKFANLMVHDFDILKLDYFI